MITGKKIHNLRSVSLVLFGASWWQKARRQTLNSEEQLWWDLGKGGCPYTYDFGEGVTCNQAHISPEDYQELVSREDAKKFSSVQLLSPVWLFATPWTAARQASLSITNSRVYSNSCSLSRWCHPTISSCHPLLLLPSIFPSIRVFSNESVLRIGWPKYWSFSFSISSSKEHSGLISFRMDWLDLLAVPGTHKSLLQHHYSNASVLWCSAFFIVQLSCPYMTTGKTIALIRWTFVGKVMSLLFNMQSRLVITFLPMSKGLFVSWLQSLVTICSDFGAPKIKSATASTDSPFIAMKWWDWMPRFLFSECWALSQLFPSPLSLHQEAL